MRLPDRISRCDLELPRRSQAGSTPDPASATEPSEPLSEPNVLRARDALGEDRYEQLRSEGARLSTADAIRLVEQFEPPPNAPPAPSPRPLGMAARGGEAGEAM